MKKTHIGKKTPSIDDAPTPVRIAIALINAGKPLKLMDISNATSLSCQLISHHLPRMKDDLVIAELNDKTYTLQPFLYDDNVVTILDNLMRTMILTILNNIETSEYREDDISKAILKNLEIFIQTFAIQKI